MAFKLCQAFRSSFFDEIWIGFWKKIKRIYFNLLLLRWPLSILLVWYSKIFSKILTTKYTGFASFVTPICHMSCIIFSVTLLWTVGSDQRHSVKLFIILFLTFMIFYHFVAAPWILSFSNLFFTICWLALVWLCVQIIVPCYNITFFRKLLF